MTIVSNSSPLIALAGLDLLSVLRPLFTEIVVPEAVWHEVVIRGEGKLDAQLIIRAVEEGWLHRRSVQDQLAVATLQATLGAGESEAIVLAREINASWLLLDDDLGRAHAQRLGLPVKGTVGVLLAAYRAEFIPDFKRVLDDLRANGFWLSDQLYQKLLSTPVDIQRSSQDE